jgi:hypothetical protein
MDGNAATGNLKINTGRRGRKSLAKDAKKREKEYQIFRNIF